MESFSTISLIVSLPMGTYKTPIGQCLWRAPAYPSPSFYTKSNGEGPERMKTDANLREMNRMACIADIITK